MPEWYQYPFKYLFNKGALQPCFIIEFNRVIKGLLDVILQLTQDTDVFPDQCDLILVEETAIIEIRRCDGEYLVIYQKKLCMKIMRNIEQHVHFILIKQSEVFITEDIDHPNV